MSDSTPSGVDLRQVHRLLKQMARLAEHSSLTGSLDDGARAAVRRYNAIVQYLERTQAIPTNFFSPLSEDASFDELGVESSLLASYIEEEEKTDDEDERERRRRHRHWRPAVAMGLGDLNKELEELRDLGKIIRENLPTWLKEQEGRPSPPPPPQPPPPPEAGGPPTDVERRMAEVSAEIQAIVEKFRDTNLSEAQRADLAEQIAKLSREQADLGRRQAETARKRPTAR